MLRLVVVINVRQTIWRTDQRRPETVSGFAWQCVLERLKFTTSIARDLRTEPHVAELRQRAELPNEEAGVVKV